MHDRTCRLQAGAFALKWSGLALALWVWSGSSQAQVPAAFAAADPVAGVALIKTAGCNACHQTKVGGDGTAVYRPGGRIKSVAQLQAQVTRCSTLTGASIFPEELVDVAAALNRDYYKFAK